MSATNLEESVVRHIRFAVGCIFVCVVGNGVAVRADLIAADSFLIGEEGLPATPDLGEYFLPSEGMRLREQNPIVDPGWTEGNPWNIGTAQLVADSFTLNAPGITYPSGGKGKFEAANPPAFRAGHREIDPYEGSDVYFMSLLVNPGGAFAGEFPDGPSHAVAGFSNPASEASFENQEGAENLFGLFVGFQGNNNGPGADDDEAHLVLRARATETGLLEDTILVPNVLGSTFHVLLKLQINFGGGIADRVEYWVNPTELASERELTNSAFAAGSLDTWAMDTNLRMTHTQVVVNNWIRNFFWDEPRLGTDLASVTGVAPRLLQCDLNVDGGVDAADAGILFGNWGHPGIGDLNGDSVVDAADAGVCFSEWTGDTPVQTIPEPACPTWIALATMAGWFIRNTVQ